MPIQPETLVEINGTKKVGVNKSVKGFTESTRSYPENFNQVFQTLIDNDVSLEDAQVGLIRNTIHSGFLNCSDLDLSEPNKITLLKEEKANINGYILTIPEGTVIELPGATTEGKREDLVFLEAWFPIEGNGYEMSWRIRSVAGVDFETYSEGIFDHNILNYSEKNELVKPQGGNSEPTSLSNAMFMFFGESVYNNPNATTHHDSEYFLHFNDLGMFIAGNGSDTSKDTLLTADGYVYAIPMFRISRRNSSEYSPENVNGAREYIKGEIYFTDGGRTVEGQEITVYTCLELRNAMHVGDIISLSGTDRAKVVSINDDETVTYLGLINGGGSSSEHYIKSDVPNGLFSNLIDQRDIIDLRHKVSLTGVDYNKLMNEEFNRLLASENGNVTMHKEYFGLKKAPSYVEVQQDSYPYVVGNIWDGSFEYGYVNHDTTNTSLTSAGNINYITTSIFRVTPNTKYTLSLNTNRREWVFFDSELNFISHIPDHNITTPSNAMYARVYFHNDTVDGGNTKPSIFIGDITDETLGTLLIPRGKWYVPADYVNQQTNTRFDLTEQKRILSDAQTSQKVSDKIEVLSNDHLKHIEVTQATVGVWSTGDTIKITCKNGLFGIIDTVDNSLAKVVRGDVNSTVLYLDDVSEFSVGDSFLIVKPSGDIWSGTTRYITAINSTEKTIQFEAVLGADVDENSVITKSIVKADGIVGKWDGVLTNESTYTIITPPNDNKETLTIEYSVNYAGGNGIEHVPKDVLEGEVNKQKLVKSDDGIVIIKANFEGKVKTNTDLNSHISRFSETNSTLISPYDSITEIANSAYSNLEKLDGKVVNGVSTSTNGEIPQQLFSFNIIRAIQDKLGEGFFEGCVTIEDKVQRAKDILGKYKFIWHGYGENPNGNASFLDVWYEEYSQWYSQRFGNPPTEHNYNSIKDLFISGESLSNKIDSNGFVHFLAHTDPSDGVTPSTIYTDYVELEIQIDVSETRYDVLVPKNEFPVMTENLLTQNQAFPIDTKDLSINSNSSTIEIGGIIKLSNLNVDDYVYPSTNTCDLLEGEPFTVSVELRGNGTISIYTFNKQGNTIKKSVQLNENDFTPFFMSDFSNGSLETIVVRKYETDTATYVEARNFKLEKGINENPTWSEGRKSKTTLNYLGKVVGDDVSVPNRTLLGSTLTDDILTRTPYSFNDESTQIGYNDLSKQDGILATNITSQLGKHRCRLFEFDLSHLGLSLSELKDKLRKLSVSWTGYGQGHDGNELAYGARMTVWNEESKIWVNGWSNTDDVPTTISVSPDPFLPYITNNQKVYILVHSTHPASAENNSIVYTDYIKLDVELSEEVDYVKSNIVKVRKETKEIKLEYNPKSYRTGITDNVALWYDHVPVPQKLESTKNVTVLAERDEILVSDLSSAAGDKQGIHHWMNPLYRVGNDSLNVFGEFGFANIPLAADSKNVNIGKEIQVNGSGFRDYFITQYGISTLQKPMVGIIGHLVMHENELKLLVVSFYNETGLIDTSQNGVGLLLPIKGKPLVKLPEGERNPAIKPTAWRTQTGEIQGYLDQDGELILTYQ
ncbi:hypothetical protein VQL36_19260 [Chengkuizengella sp. SCS-71B]|uniref:hypothetical protein n=1 Tax=Chengkuizengella sp. SCS-71B TaxID=3115290 RepID=UPI0032C2487A